MTTSDLSTYIKNQALELGFDACGIAKANQISEAEISHYRTWIEGHYHSGMRYMANHSDMRYDPRLLVEGCRSLIIVALNYEPLEKQRSESPQIARFAYGKDYHEIIRAKLRTLLQNMNELGLNVNGRAFADSAPVAERYWAREAGLGWIGKNHHLIIPGKGSFFLLGELLVDLDLDYDTPVKNRCGNCRQCMEACPVRALNDTSGLDANRCLAYLTIEKQGPFNAMESASVGQNNSLFGCDKCQDACPWNRFASGNKTPGLQPKDGLLSMVKADFEEMTEEDFISFFSGTCFERAGFEGFIRNLNAIKKSSHLFR